MSLSLHPLADKRSDSCGDEEDLLAALAAHVTGRGLRAPAWLLLEVAQPLHWLIQQALLVAHPLVRPWAGDRALVWARLLENREFLARMQQALGDRPDEER